MTEQLGKPDLLLVVLYLVRQLVAVFLRSAGQSYLTEVALKVLSSPDLDGPLSILLPTWSDFYLAWLFPSFETCFSLLQLKRKLYCSWLHLLPFWCIPLRSSLLGSSDCSKPCADGVLGLIELGLMDGGFGVGEKARRGWVAEGTRRLGA